MATPLANAWLVDAPGGWVLVDTGGPGYAGRIVHHAERRYGRGTRPHAIVLTHGHLDHAGSASRLSRMWGVPVLAHRRELPYLDGRAVYEPAHPETGGPLAALARSLPACPQDLRPRLRPLPLDGRVPFLPGWRWVRTPGPTPGHVSLLRTTDRVLLAGDASVHALIPLEPAAIAAGHGLPVALVPPGAGTEVPPTPVRPARCAAAVGLLALAAGMVLRTLRRAPLAA